MGERAVRDRPDDLTGAQIHIVYAVCSDCTDREFDTNGRVEGSIAVFQDWLAGQTGGRRLRIDTFQGHVDITFYRDPRTKAELALRGSALVNDLFDGLKDAGVTSGGKRYLIYYDGSNVETCGSS